MIVRSDVAHDARVVREAEALRDDGHAVRIIGKDVPEDWARPDGIVVDSVGARSAFGRSAPRGRPLPPHLAAARWALLPRHNASVWASFLAAAEHRADELAASSAHGSSEPGAAPESAFDVVHAHDFPVLPLATRLARRHGARLVYDAHEWWSGRLRAGRPTPVADARERRVERELAARADAVLTVSPGIVERFAEAGVPGVHLVRNTFPARAHGPVGSPPSGVVYAGRLGPGRDLETVLAAAHRVPALPLTLVGPADQGWLGALEHAGRRDEGVGGAGGAEGGLPPGARVLPHVAPDDVDALLQQAGVSLVTLEDSCENHRLALPNKLFQAARAGVPVVAADLPEIRRLVQGHDLGVLYRPGDVGSLVDALTQVRARHAELVAAVAAAAPSLTWAADAERLRSVYRGLSGAAG
ncbi:MAG TPA: glycosyltransferase [Motilibacteraceae bacterium]|nr:glycosyltransferase [Motilibacteraceae bacterium]